MTKTVYEKIKEIRLNKKMSQKELGQKVGLSQQAIALLEKGKRKLDVETLENIISILQPTFSEYMDILDLNPEYEKGQQNALEILSYLWELNHEGQKKAIEQVEMLTKIEEYTKKD